MRRRALAIVAPVLPALTMADARPSRTASAARTSDESFLRLTLAASSSMAMTSPVGVPLQSEFAEITLIDHEPLAAAIQITIQDPAEVELRERIVRAIQARIRQDPIFAAEWRALVGG